MTIKFDIGQLERSIRKAIAEHMTALAPGAPQLFWTLHYDITARHFRLSGFATAPELDDPAAAVDQWAEVLGLDSEEADDDGTRTFFGKLPIEMGSLFLQDELPIRIWHIADADAFAVEGASLTTRYGDAQPGAGDQAVTE